MYGVEDRLVLVAVLKVGNRAQIYQRLRDSDVDLLRGLIDPERGSAEPER